MRRQYATLLSVVVSTGLSFAWTAMAASSHHVFWPKANQNFPNLASLHPNRQQQMMHSSACRDFTNYMTGHIDQKGGFNTDQLIVLKRGVIDYEWSGPDTQLYKRHNLWSASKTITGTLIGAAIQDDLPDPKHNKFMLNTPMTDFMSAHWRNELVTNPGPYEADYKKVTIGNLLDMTAGLQWTEVYGGNLAKSTLAQMLYGPGHVNMPAYVLSQPMTKWMPGMHYNYSSGNFNVLMMALAFQYPGRYADSENPPRYADLPDTLLFHRIGIEDALYERDGAGFLVGSSYCHMNPYDMLRIGYLYLHHGVWNNDRILPKGWVQAASQITEGLTPKVINQLTPQEKTKLRAYVKEEGVYGDRSLWINQGVPLLNYPTDFPHSPKDMIFAAGHYGQVIVILPTQHMIIVRTGHDSEYWKEIDPMVHKAVECFAPHKEPSL